MSHSRRDWLGSLCYCTCCCVDKNTGEEWGEWQTLPDGDPWHRRIDCSCKWRWFPVQYYECDLPAGLMLRRAIDIGGPLVEDVKRVLAMRMGLLQEMGG